jgi:GNAT superfamily N-acetyltransferase
MSYELIVVSTADDLARYHDIRRVELFEARGRSTYDSNRPEEKKAGHFQMLLKLDGVGIATTRFDLLGDGVAVIRLVAVTKREQRKGHGRVLAELIEAFAAGKGVSKLVVNAAPDAVQYYGRMGFVPESWNPAELVGIAADNLQMAKYLR